MPKPPTASATIVIRLQAPKLATNPKKQAEHRVDVERIVPSEVCG